MPTPTSLTFDLTPPRRPGISDLGGGQKLQRSDAPPDPVNSVTANDANQWALQLAALGRMCAAALVYVTQVSGVYTVVQVAAPGDNVAASAFTLTKNGTGDVTITWSPTLLPTPVMPAGVSVLGGTATTSCLAVVTTSSVRVKFGVDSAFLLTIY